MPEGFKLPEEVRVELYRVNNAKTNEGYRLLSDTLFENVPKELPTIIMSGDNDIKKTTTTTTTD